ncbi:MAG: hypothetical protein ACRDTA_15245 [Pseudonocardiaceae bacterium]
MSEEVPAGAQAESLLYGLNRTLLNLHSALTVVSDTNEDLIDRCRDVLRRTLVAQLCCW